MKKPLNIVKCFKKEVFSCILAYMGFLINMNKVENFISSISQYPVTLGDSHEPYLFKPSFFSFDTIVFSFFLSDKERDRFSHFKRLSDTIFHSNSDKFPSRLYSNFELLHEDEFENIKSYESRPKFKINDVGKVTFQVSVPKLYYGTNLFLFSDLERFFKDFYDLLNYSINKGYDDYVSVPHYFTWVINRIDWCLNFQFDDEKQVDGLLDFIKNCEFRGRKCYRGSKEFPYFVWENRTLKFYNKYEEMEKHKKYHDMSYHNLALGVFRIEEEWRSKYIRESILKVSRVSECTVSRFLQFIKGFNFRDKLNDILKNIIFKFKHNVNLTIKEINSKIFSYYKLKVLGTKNYCKFSDYASGVIQFYSEAVFMNRDEMKKKYGRGIVYRRERFFRDLGIPIRWDTQRIESMHQVDDSLFSDDRICYFGGTL